MTASDRLIAYMSRAETLYPGDFIGSGTISGPQGSVPCLRRCVCDVLTCRVDCALAACQQRDRVGCHVGEVDHVLAVGCERPEALAAVTVLVGEDLHRIAFRCSQRQATPSNARARAIGLLGIGPVPSSSRSSGWRR